MFRKRKSLCPLCKTGKETYELDKRSDFCPYIYAYRGNKCSCYVPLDTPENEKKGIIMRIKKWMNR